MPLPFENIRKEKQIRPTEKRKIISPEFLKFRKMSNVVLIDNTSKRLS